MDRQMLEADVCKDKFGIKLQLDERVQQYHDCTQMEWNTNEDNGISLHGAFLNSLTILGEVYARDRKLVGLKEPEV